jgi:hypothetical protein
MTEDDEHLLLAIRLRKDQLQANFACWLRSLCAPDGKEPR